MSAFRACAKTPMWDSTPLPALRRGHQKVWCATLPVPVDYADPGHGSLDRALVLDGPAPFARPTTASPARDGFGRSPCVAEHVTLYLVELRVPGGQAC